MPGELERTLQKFICLGTKISYGNKLIREAWSHVKAIICEGKGNSEYRVGGATHIQLLAHILTDLTSKKK